MPRSKNSEVIDHDGSLLGYIVPSANGYLLAFDSEFGFLGSAPTACAARAMIKDNLEMMEHVPALREWPRRAA